MLCYMQAGLEEKISQLLDEKGNLVLKGVLVLYLSLLLSGANNLFSPHSKNVGIQNEFTFKMFHRQA